MLEDGRVFYGKAFGALGEAMGEVCFNTGMTGYQEILTDPSYCGQIVTMTYPHIGNYGVNADDVESSRIQVAGFVVKDGTEIPSNYRSEASLNEYLQSAKIVGIQGIDTRALTRHIRDRGSMNGIISSNDLDDISLKKKIAEIPTMAGLDLVPKVTCKELYSWPDSSKRQEYNVVAIDFGIKHNILRLLSHHGCKTTIVPATTTVDEIMSINPDGVFLSNGPGDPSAVTYGINTIKDILGKKPIFGICLGHQILGLALGAKTKKMKLGHRGANHPVKNLIDGKVEITSQNHGFEIVQRDLPKNIEITHKSLFDNSIEGIRLKNKPVFSVQYHPEANPGPQDSVYLFKKFIGLMNA